MRRQIEIWSADFSFELSEDEAKRLAPRLIDKGISFAIRWDGDMVELYVVNADVNRVKKMRQLLSLE